MAVLFYLQHPATLLYILLVLSPCLKIRFRDKLSSSLGASALQIAADCLE